MKTPELLKLKTSSKLNLQLFWTFTENWKFMTFWLLSVKLNRLPWIHELEGSLLATPSIVTLSILNFSISQTYIIDKTSSKSNKVKYAESIYF